jgi:hypothetical protein
VNDQLRKLGSLFGYLTNTSCCILTDLNVNVLKAVQDAGENFGFNDNFSEVNGVLCDLSEALADVSLKLGVWVGDKCSKVGDGTLVNDCLRKLLGVLGNFRQSGC